MKRERERVPFELVLYLFSEGSTEIEYLKDLVRYLKLEKRIRVISPIQPVSAPHKLLDESLRWIERKYQRESLGKRVRVEFWLLFDDDERPDEMERLQSAISTNQKRIEKAGLRFAWMAPCIELWPLLHLMVPSRTPQAHHAIQSRLEREMPSYKHEGNPYFNLSGDLGDPQKINLAILRGEQLSASVDPFPQCLGHATRYAGIHPIVKQILSFVPTPSFGSHEG